MVGFPKAQKIALKAKSGRSAQHSRRALILETFQSFQPLSKSEKINAADNPADVEKIGSQEPTMNGNSRPFLDNAATITPRYIAPWLERSERQVKVHFLPPYAPHLNPIERPLGRHA